MWNSFQRLDIETHAWNSLLRELISGKWKQPAVNRGKFQLKIWNPFCNQQQHCEVICQALTMLRYYELISGRGSVKLYLTWPDASSVQEVTISRKKWWFPGREHGFYHLQNHELSVAPNCFVRKAYWRKSIALYAFLSTPKMLPLSFLPLVLSAAATTPPFISGHPAQDSPPHPPLLLSLPLRGDPSESSVSGFQLASAQMLLERWQQLIFFLYLKMLQNADWVLTR